MVSSITYKIFTNSVPNAQKNAKLRLKNRPDHSLCGNYVSSLIMRMIRKFSIHSVG